MTATGNASWLEIIWTVSMAVALIALLTSTVIVIRKYRLYRQPDPVTGKRGNGAGVWLFWKDLVLYGLLILVTGTFTWVGLMAMQVPEPVREPNRESSQLIAFIFIGVAIGTALYAILNLWMGFQIERAIMREDKKDGVKARWGRHKG